MIPFLGGLFDEVKISINKAIEELTNLSNYVQRLRELIRELADEKNIDLDEERTYLGDKFLWITRTYYFDLFNRYLENTTNVINTLEEIYPLLKNDADFV